MLSFIKFEKLVIVRILVGWKILNWKKNGKGQYSFFANVFIQFPVTLNFRYKANKTVSMNEEQSKIKIS